jgi:hypothetical protein
MGGNKIYVQKFGEKIFEKKKVGGQLLEGVSKFVVMVQNGWN